MYKIHLIFPNFFFADSSTFKTLNPSSPTDGGFIFFSIQFIKDLHSINKGYFLKLKVIVLPFDLLMIGTAPSHLTSWS